MGLSAPKWTQAEVAAAYGDGLKRKGPELEGPCPVCHGTDRFYIQPNGRFHCRQNLGDRSHFKAMVEALGLESSRRPEPNGEPIVDRYSYYDANLEHVADAVRTTRPNGSKTFRIEWKGPKPDRNPLYRLTAALRRPDLPVLVVEGEKVADAATRLLADFVAVTSMNGSNAARRTDWTPLKGREVTIWPDADDAGHKYAQTVAKLCQDAGAASVRIVQLPDGLPKGWDLADVVPAGLDVDLTLEGAVAPKLATEPDPGEAKPTPTKAKEREIIDRTAEGLLTALKHLEYELRWNLRMRRMEWRIGGADWIPETDRLVADLRDRIQEDFDFMSNNPKSSATRPARFGMVTLREEANALAYHREVDTFLDYLNGLPKWDKISRLDSLLSDLFHIPGDRDLATWAGRFPLMGAVKRTLRPGAKLDETPVLIGAQGIGKSTLYRLLLEDPSWFGDYIDLSGTNKEQSESIAGTVIVEMAEMIGSTKAEILRIRTFLSRIDDGQHRAAYARAKEPAPRRCVFIGTANDHNPLPNDPDGNRRFVAVTIEPHPDVSVADLRAWLVETRDQLWAEALHRINAGEEARFPDHLKDKQKSVNEEHRHRDPLAEEALDAWIGTNGDGPHPFADILDGVNRVRPGTYDARKDSIKLSRLLRQRGFTNPNKVWATGEKKRRMWIKSNTE